MEYESPEETYRAAIRALTGDSPNPELGVQLLKMSSDAGHFRAKAVLGRFYLRPIASMQYDLQHGIDLLVESVNAGDNVAKAFVETIYYRSTVTFKLAEMPVDVYQSLAIDTDSCLAQLVDEERARPDPVVEVAIGLLLDERYGEKQNALAWYRLSSERWNFAAAHHNYGHLMNDDKIPGRAAECTALYRRGAEQHYSPSTFNYAYCLMNGSGVDKDEQAGIAYYREAAAQHHPYATFNLGMCYFRGTGVKTDHVEAKRLFERALELRVADAGALLGHMATLGLGMEGDDVRAMAYLSRGAALGSSSAMYSQSMLYRHYRMDVPDRQELARYWLQRSASFGMWSQAILLLASDYEAEKNYTLAYLWGSKVPSHAEAAAELEFQGIYPLR